MDYDALFKLQKGKCAICGEPWKPETKAGKKARRLHRDHNRTTMQPRGLLCHRCNRHLKDWFPADWYLAAFKYLERYDG